jgi:hypothetical protein
VNPEDQRDQDWSEHPCNTRVSVVGRRQLAILGAFNAWASDSGNIPSRRENLRTTDVPWRTKLRVIRQITHVHAGTPVAL